ncbi:MAG TPA: cell envelope integrity protein TolA [Methylibium sp.]|nr:cell envelope integrity protein TolA [Methylibium sp.]
MHVASTLDDLRPRAGGGLPRAATLALIAHGLLIIALSLGVSWRSTEPAGIEAELWAAVPQAAAPRAVEPEPQPEPPPKPAPRAEPPPPPPVNRDAEIAREKREAEKARLEKRREEEEKREKLEKQRLAEEREAEKREAEKRKKTEAERQAKLDALRAENLKRITGEADATGAPGSSGTAAQSAGPSASYAGRIKARIKPNIVFSDEVAGNPVASVEVKVAPDGTIVGRRLARSSGVPAWDEAVLRAIDKTEVLPRDVDGRVPPTMVIDFRPRD